MFHFPHALSPRSGVLIMTVAVSWALVKPLTGSPGWVIVVGGIGAVAPGGS
jgi:hypothetical protein